METQDYRQEWKFFITNQESFQLKIQMGQWMEIDSHTLAGQDTYTVHSLYFDDRKNSSAYAVEMQLPYRYKWRIRYYGNDSNFLVLEKKEKLEDRCCKKRCNITIDEFEQICERKTEAFLFDTKKELLKELAKDIMIDGYHPKTIIDYERMAFVEEFLKLRVTFDCNIFVSNELDNFLEGDYFHVPVLPNNIGVMEVKYATNLPLQIKKIMKENRMERISFSKYYSGREALSDLMR